MATGRRPGSQNLLGRRQPESQVLPDDYVPNVDRTYGQVLGATVPAASWPETWFSLISLKGHLQGVPTFAGLQVWAAPSPTGDYRITAICSWDSFDALEQWLAGGWTVQDVLLALAPPATNIEVSICEEVT